MITALQTIAVLFFSVSVYLITRQVTDASSSYRLPAGERKTRYETMTAILRFYPVVHRLLWLWTRILSPVIPSDTIQRYDQKLLSAGSPGGLNGAEFIATVPLFAITLAICGALLSNLIASQILPGILLGGLSGVVLPVSRLDSIIVQRKKVILTGLPYAIDLIALCMRAGQTFHGAIATVTAEMAKSHPLQFELTGMAARIALGSSTIESLQTLAMRIDCPEVRQFVQSAVRSHQKGSSLADIFSIQANIIRTRRSEAAEQTASRAAVAMLGPLMLIFLAVFVVLLGPFGVKAFYGELF